MKSRSNDWWIVGGLIFLSCVPVIAGVHRLVLVANANGTPDNARFIAGPIAIWAHVLSSLIFSLLGAVQFAPSVRSTWPRWHRVAGRFLVVASFIVALSGIWMTLFYPRAGFDGVGLFIARLLAGTGMLSFTVLGLVAIRKRDFVAHGNWMIRSYAVAMGAGTQVLTHVPLFLFPSLQGELSRFICMTFGWLINLWVAEIAIGEGFRMKKVSRNALAIFVMSLVTLSAFASGGGDRHNLTSNALGGALGVFNLEYSYRFTNHGTLGLMGSSGQARIGEIGIQGSAVGLIGRYYLKPAFEENSWYVVSSVEKKSFEARASDNNVDYRGDLKDVVASLGAGYHWFWDSFNIGFGLLGTSSPDLELKDTAGRSFGETLSQRLSVDFTIGGKF